MKQIWLDDDEVRNAATKLAHRVYEYAGQKLKLLRTHQTEPKTLFLILEE